MSTEQDIAAYLDTVSKATDAVDKGVLATVMDRLELAYHEEQSVYIIGNGGSAANASHFSEDLAKGALQDEWEKRFRVHSLTDNTPFITAIGNDLGYDRIFKFQLRQFAEAGDVLIAISGSGNSPNIIEAVDWAREHDIDIISFTGFEGGKLALMSGINVHVQLIDMCQSEAVHSVLMHLIVDLLRDRLAG
ncbi:MAG: SIS domain-containing protein [Kiritimatiellia bacterium]|jgi:D-sedoheptulose 7-phosphate isomerase|nr:SIS domain-containing protein [Kiritimatiellia bacterium]